MSSLALANFGRRELFPLYASQDGEHPAVQEVLAGLLGTVHYLQVSGGHWRRVDPCAALVSTLYHSHATAASRGFATRALQPRREDCLLQNCQSLQVRVREGIEVFKRDHERIMNRL